MTKLQISVTLKGGGKKPLDIDLVDPCLKEEVFLKGHENDLEKQKTFISCLVWGCIGYHINAPIEIQSVKCIVEFDNGNQRELPHVVLHDIHRLTGA